MKKFVCVALGAVLALTVTAGERPVSDPSASVPAGARASATAPASLGMVAHLDPVTGLPAEPTPLDMRELKAGPPINQSSEGLVETASPVAGGGLMVDLQGRFQNSMTATIDPVQGTSTTCLSVPAVAQAPAAGEVK